jgi:cell division protein FtsL
MATAVMLPKAVSRARHGLASGRAAFPEIYFRKPIDNSRLRRDVDPAKRRQCYSLLGLSVLVFFSLLLISWQHFQCVRYGYQIQQLRSEQASLEEWNSRLRMEEASLADPQRIDNLARTQLGLIPPQAGQVIPVGASPASSEQGVEYARNLTKSGATHSD